MMITDIKAALVARLETIAGMTGKVFSDRTRAYAELELPCIEVRFDGADPERKEDHYLTWRARFSIDVLVKLAETARPDTAAEQLLGSIQGKLYTDLKLADTLDEEIEIGSVSPDEDAAGDRVARRLSQALVCRYVDELYGDPIDEFLTADIEFDLAGPRNDPQTPAQPDGQIDAAVTINLPQ